MAIDIIFAALMVWGAYKGLSRGLIRPVLSFVAIFVALLAAFKFGNIISEWLRGWVSETTFLPLLSFIIVLIVILLLTKILISFLEKTLKFTQLNFLNRLGGAALWCGLFLLLFLLCLWLFSRAGLISPELKKSSMVFNPVHALFPLITDIFAGFFSFLEFLTQFIEQII